MVEISIHVPAWGTTEVPESSYAVNTNFNPRSRVGNDRNQRLLSHPPGYFNPRSRVGNDSAGEYNQQEHEHFNPRSRVGNDFPETIIDSVFEISIHVPAWGTTSYHRAINKPWGDFNPRSRVGNDTRKVIKTTNQIKYFNPRSRVGNDCKFSQIFFAFLCNKYNFSTFYYPFSLFFGVIHFTFLIFAVRILPIFYVYF